MMIMVDVRAEINRVCHICCLDQIYSERGMLIKNLILRVQRKQFFGENSNYNNDFFTS